MSATKLYNQTGEVVGQVELDQKIFGLKLNPGLIEQAIMTQRANSRQVLAHTQTKADVRGGGRKPWKQKGTGRARHGSIRSPQWKGGGVIFGPRKNRNFSIKMNASARRKALLMALTDKAQSDRLVIVNEVKLDQPKTKLFASVLKKLPQQKNSLVVMPSDNTSLIKVGRNIPGLQFIRANSLNVYDIVRHQQLIVLQPALPIISKTYSQ